MSIAQCRNRCWRSSRRSTAYWPCATCLSSNRNAPDNAHHGEFAQRRDPTRPDCMNDKLKTLRLKIDALDARLVKLLSERARLAQRVGQAKQGAAAYRPEREAQILRRVVEMNPGPLPDRALQ